MALSRVKTWADDEVLTHSDLNAEFQNILDNANSLVSPFTAAIDLNGVEMIIDADADSSLTADTDDRLDIKLGGVDLFRFDGTVASVTNGLDFIASATGVNVVITAVGGDTNIPVTLRGKGTGHILLGTATSTDVRLAADQPIADSSGNELIKFSKAASAVNEITIGNAATGGGPIISATGGDTNIDINIDPKGTGEVVVRQTDAGALVGPVLALYRDSASPAASDVIGGLSFKGKDSGGNITTYGLIRCDIVDPTNTTEDSSLVFRRLVNANEGTAMTITQGVIVGAATGGDQGVGTLNATAVYDDGVLLCRPVARAVRPVPDQVWHDVAPTGENHLVAVDRAYEERGLDGSAEKFAQLLAADATAPGLFTLEEMQARKAAGEKFSISERAERLWIAVEYAALAIRDLTAKNADLEARLKALEAK